MDDKYLSTLEYFKILDQLAAHTAFSASQELALSLRPSSDEDAVRLMIQETTEAKALLSKRGEVTVGGTRDVRPLARRAALEAMLQPSELLEIRNTLLAGRSLRQLLAPLAEDYPLLSAKAAGIQPLSHIIEAVDRCLDDEGLVLDSASPALARIRMQSRAARQRLLDRLHRMVTSGENAQYLQEPLVTERNGRFVIPLKVDFKGRIPGIIHDQSASGATLFIEPLVTVELNNEWHELQLAEKREIERILAELSRMVGEVAQPIASNVVALAELDLALAKGHYSFALHAGPAEISASRWPIAGPEDTLLPSEHPLHLIRARHPLLPSDSVVPIDVYIGGNYSVLLVSGPNTGGKTVALKTVGLLAAMSQAGLHVPAGEGSKSPVFTGIYADIGDEQSIEQSLSTFSSHLTRIIDILERADAGSLVLLDEIGAGTDPTEGSALAQALIGRLLERRCLTLCSSHHSQLKVFAFSTPGVQNASVEFDIETLSPTYRLIIGLPGRSNALAIAGKLGLNGEIIERARALLSPEDLEADLLLDKVKAARDATEQASREAETTRGRAKELERELRVALAGIEQTRRQVLDQARGQGRRELAELRSELSRLRLETMRQGMPSGMLQEAIAAIAQVAEKMAPLEPIRESAHPSSRSLQAGDSVYVKSLDQVGELLAIEDQAAEVRVGSFRLRTQRDALELRPHPEPPTEKEESPAQRLRVSPPSIELDLRGLRAADIAPILDKHLNDAFLSRLPWTQIIHGKGMGVLKKVVREILASHPLVSTYRAGDLSEGGDGVTVVHLVKLPD